MSRRTAKPGFSLVEVVLVAAILGVVAAVAMPRFASAISRRRIWSAAERMVHDMRRAAEDARAQATTVTVVFDGGRDSYKAVTGYGTAEETRLWATDLSAAPYEADIVAIDLTDAAVVIEIDGFGGFQDSGGVVLRSGSEFLAVRLGDAIVSASDPSNVIEADPDAINAMIPDALADVKAVLLK